MAENKMQTVKEYIKYVYESDSKEERKKRLCQVIAEWLTKNATKNKMEFIAAMFGKKLGEPFNAKRKKDKVGNWVMFSPLGVVYVDVPEDRQNWLLVNLLTGEYEIVEDKK